MNLEKDNHSLKMKTINTIENNDSRMFNSDIENSSSKKMSTQKSNSSLKRNKSDPNI